MYGFLTFLRRKKYVAKNRRANAAAHSLICENQKVFIVVGVQLADFECLEAVNLLEDVFGCRVVDLWLYFHA
jgi:hypothetical protein